MGAREELVIYVLLVTIGAIPVLSTLASGARFAVEETVGLIMIIAGLAGLVSIARHRWDAK